MCYTFYMRFKNKIYFPHLILILIIVFILWLDHRPSAEVTDPSQCTEVTWPPLVKAFRMINVPKKTNYDPSDSDHLKAIPVGNEIDTTTGLPIPPNDWYCVATGWESNFDYIESSGTNNHEVWTYFAGGSWYWVIKSAGEERTDVDALCFRKGFAKWDDGLGLGPTSLWFPPY